MFDPNFILLYVEKPQSSAEFYAALLGKQPVESSPNFAMFLLGSGLRLGLWALHDVLPAVTAQSFGGEIGLEVDSDDAVGKTHRAWVAKGIRIAQTPTRMDFGYTFVGLDPDGHRLRVFAPAMR